MTEELFREDAYLKSCEARVVAVDDDESHDVFRRSRVLHLEVAVQRWRRGPERAATEQAGEVQPPCNRGGGWPSSKYAAQQHTWRNHWRSFSRCVESDE